MLGELTRAELGLWYALWQTDPWGDMRADRRAAIGHALLANVNRNKSVRPHPFTEFDFMPYYERSAEQEQAQLDTRLFHTLTAAGGGGERKAWDKSEWRRRRKDVGKGRK